MRPVVAVLGAQDEAVRSGIQRAAAVTAVHNPDYSQGQLSSMQCGLHAVPADADGVLFTLVDHPALAVDTIDKLVDLPGRAPLRIPRFNGRRGHPIWFSNSLIADFLALPAGAAARDVVTRHEREIAYIDVDDAGILADVDDRAAYASLLARSSA